jgi:dTDP-4-amino-4,6-dideoxygalactose transaminase
LAFVIDGAQSHLAKSEGFSFSSYADIATLSFYPGKNLGALGEGGAVLTNSLDLKERILRMRDWGAVEKYKHESWGGNFRLESIQAAFLQIKIQHLENWTRERIAIATRYDEELAASLKMQPAGVKFEHVYHIYSIKVPDPEGYSAKLKSHSIGHGFHYPIAVHKQIFYRDKVKLVMSLSNAESLAATTLSLPIFPGMTNEEIDRVLRVVGEIRE